jgi:hypothetical protein
MLPVSLNFLLNALASQVESRGRTLPDQCRLISGLLTFSIQKAMIPATPIHKEHNAHDK